MRSLFEPEAKRETLDRLAALSPQAERQWGKMTAAQMLAHCSVPLEQAVGERPSRQKLIGKIFAPFVRSRFFDERPFSKNAPTDPDFKVSDPRDFVREQRRLTEVVERFCDRGPDEASRRPHTFLGTISGHEWGVVMYKHLDHHLRQFGG